MKKLAFTALAVVITQSACASTGTQGNTSVPPATPTVQAVNQASVSPLTKEPLLTTNANSVLDNHPYAELIAESEINATPSAKKVLVSARKMVEEGEIIKGGCWDYLNTAWNRAGFIANKKSRKVMFKGKIDTPPYATADDIQAGDWLYHINYSYNNIEHSGMFIGWVDKENMLGVTLSYAGERRGEPGRYRVYDLSGVYTIFRASE